MPRCHVGARELSPAEADHSLHEAGLPASFLYPFQTLPVQKEQAACAERDDTVVDDIRVEGTVAKLPERDVRGACGQDAQ